MNMYVVNYDDKTLTLYYNGGRHDFDLNDGDVGDFWHSFTSDDEVYDINFHQEDAHAIPSLSVYKCGKNEFDEWEVMTSDYETIIPLAYGGDATNYFNH